MTRTVAAVSGALALQLIALVLAHDLTFLARFGSRYGEELAHAGHGQAWSMAVLSSVVIAAVLAALATGRLITLGVRVRQQRPHGVAAKGELRRVLRAWVSLSIRIGVLSVVLLTIQENIERIAIGQAAPGVGLLLSPEYPFGLWIALTVGATVALVAALFASRQRVLLGRLGAARQSLPPVRAVAQPRRRIEPARARDSILGRRSGLRAPPVVTPA
jgi:hypothetical protein